MSNRKLDWRRKSVYATGDFTVNTALASLSMIYASYFLIEVAALRPALAAMVPFVGRVVDAVTDPLMGRISDRTRWAGGRRRPYFLIGALPFGVSFALLWANPPDVSQFERFLYFTATYCVLSVAITILSVPYLALQPEMAEDYDDRTSLNTYRNAASVLGVAAAIAIRPLAETVGGGTSGFASAGIVMGVVVTVPWVAVHAVSFERPEFQSRAAELGWREGLEVVLRHATFRRLIGLYLTGRIGLDIVTTMIVIYMTHWLARSEDFELVMLLFLGSSVFSLPLWLYIARRFEKSAAYVFGTVWWAMSLLLLGIAQPDWPRWTSLVYGPLMGIGFAAVDLMPWSMVGDVIDEDDLSCGERREGLYNGLFTFLRKLGGAVAVSIVLLTLDLSGFRKDGSQSDEVMTTIRALTSVVPFVFVAVSGWLALGYPLTRTRHGRVLAEIRERDEGRWPTA